METNDGIAQRKRKLLEMSEMSLPQNFSSTKHASNSKMFVDKDDYWNDVVDKLFEKHFTIVTDSRYTLPKVETMFTENAWRVDRLQQLKEELNDTKSRLNDYNLEDWHSHTCITNKAANILCTVRQMSDPEFLTQAWCKFYENACRFSLVPTTAITDKEFTSVHLCEAPGAFVTSLNHWLKTHIPSLNWSWIATSLNPYYEGNPLSRMINDDRFIIHTLDHWFFGADNTGNLMDLKNMDALVELSKGKRNVLLVTADGSIDCTDDPAEQEIAVARLHYCEAVTALHLLHTGGTFLLKIFTIFEHQSVCLMYLLSCCFDTVHVNKPATSKEGNSEVYVVCLRYKGLDYAMPYLNTLRKQYGNGSDTAMFRREDIPTDFVEQIVACADFFKIRQCEVITENIGMYTPGDHARVRSFMTTVKRLVVNRFLERYELKRLPSENLKIVGKSILTRTIGCGADSKDVDTSYNERCKRKHLEPLERLLILASDSKFQESPPPIRFFKLTEAPGKLYIRTGKPFAKVQSSKFCPARVLKVYVQILDIMEQMHLQVHLPESEGLPCVFVEEAPIDFGNCAFLHFQFTEITDGEIANKISEKLESIKKGDSLGLIGFSLLTQLNVGLLYLAGRTFESLRFISNDIVGSIIILHNYTASEEVLACLREIGDAAVAARNKGEVVLSVFPIKELCDTALYPHIVEINQWVIKYCNNCIVQRAINIA